MRLWKEVAGVSPRRRGAFLFAEAFVLMVAAADLCGCSIPLDDVGAVLKTGTVRASTLQQMASLNMDREAPVLLRIYKKESTLEVWKRDRGGKYALLKSYPICKFSGRLGPKISEGDHQAPEGFYDITPGQMNPLSREYLAFNIGFPNAFDRSLGRTGSFLMVHGGCNSTGCYAMTDQHMDEIYGLVGEAFAGGQDKVQLEALPFRMTPENLARNAQNNPNASFWTMLKAGSDAFLKDGRPPAVVVCDHRYVFNPVATRSDRDPSTPCPPDIASSLVAEDARSPKSSFAIMIPSYQASTGRKALLSPKLTLKAALIRRREVSHKNLHGAKRRQKTIAIGGLPSQRAANRRVRSI